MALVRWWRWTVVAAVACVASGCALFRSHPEPPPVVSGVQVGVASWYGPGFHGRPTASGEIFDQQQLTAAHPSLPLGSRARITSLTNHRSVDVRINDRGPFVDGRIVDLSYAAACRIDMIGPGVMPVRLEVLGATPAPPALAATPALRRASEPPPAAARAAAPLPDATPPRRRVLAPDPSVVRTVSATAPAPSWFLVQLGAFREREAADQVQREVARRFPDARVTSLVADGDRAYRVQLGPYAARRSAEARAEVVGRLGYPATVLASPEP
jgi:rare lipoprotein A